MNTTRDQQIADRKLDADGYCRDCRTKHGPWGHFEDDGSVAAGMAADVKRYLNTGNPALDALRRNVTGRVLSGESEANHSVERCRYRCDLNPRLAKDCPWSGHDTSRPNEES